MLCLIGICPAMQGSDAQLMLLVAGTDCRGYVLKIMYCRSQREQLSGNCSAEVLQKQELV